MIRTWNWPDLSTWSLHFSLSQQVNLSDKSLIKIIKRVSFLIGNIFQCRINIRRLASHHRKHGKNTLAWFLTYTQNGWCWEKDYSSTTASCHRIGHTEVSLLSEPHSCVLLASEHEPVSNFHPSNCHNTSKTVQHFYNYNLCRKSRQINMRSAKVGPYYILKWDFCIILFCASVT